MSVTPLKERGEVSAQGDGATVPYPTDPSVLRIESAATAGAKPPRADRAPESVGITLSNAITVLNATALSAPTLRRVGGYVVLAYRESDINDLRDLLSRAKAQAELEAGQLKTARTNVALARAEARRLSLALERRAGAAR